jgi:carboxyl-terminal processing protease
MERWQRYLIVGLAVLVGGFGVFAAGFSVGKDDRTSVELGEEAADGSTLIQEAYDEIMSSSAERPDPLQLARAAVKAMIKELRRDDDPYALYYSPKGFRSFQRFTSGKFSGIGVWLKPKGGHIEIVSVLPGTPAQETGIQRGDVILEVDDEKVVARRADDAVNLIKGPAGSDVNLLIERSGERLSFNITRAEIEFPNLRASLRDGGLGHVRLLTFGRRAGKQVRAEVEGLLDKGAEGIILDLRDNGGGLFSEAIEVASVFIEDGEIVTYRDKDDDLVYEAEGDAFEKIPLVVLVNEGTASSSEIVAGALQDRDRAVLVGMTTYGKGSVQEVVPLSDASAVKVTTAAYLTPGGRNLSGKGIDPDVKVEGKPSAQLQRAAEILQGLVLSTDGAHG